MKHKWPFCFGAEFVAAFCRAFVVVIVFCSQLNYAHAEVSISGSKDAVTVRANNASLEDIFAAANAALNVKMSISPTIHLAITGTYSGPIRRVIARMLDGHNFILSSSGGQMVVVLATPNGTSEVRSGANLSPSPLRQNNSTATTGKNLANPEDVPNISGVQGWAGGFSLNPARSTNPN